MWCVSETPAPLTFCVLSKVGRLAYAPMSSLKNLKVKIYADGADPKMIETFAENPAIAGFTTNPSLMKQAGITDYEGFARQLLKTLKKPISFEVFADELSEMHRQAQMIKTWGENVFVKIPVTNSKGESCAQLVKELSSEGVKLNVTALFSSRQLTTVWNAIDKKTPAILSVFAGRIADTGRDPLPLMHECRKIMGARGPVELLWASSRELFNIWQADETGCDIITVAPDILKKLSMVGRDPEELSLETVRTFKKDSEAAGFSLRAK